jgi:hypothetical protein
MVYTVAQSGNKLRFRFPADMIAPGTPVSVFKSFVENGFIVRSDVRSGNYYTAHGEGLSGGKVRYSYIALEVGAFGFKHGDKCEVSKNGDIISVIAV